MTEPRNWDKELADIDRVIAKGGAVAPPAGGPPARIGTGGPAPAPVPHGLPARRRDVAGVWFRALVGVVGAAALPFWPYGRTCGTMLYVYLLGAAAVAAAGLSTMRFAWVHRRGVALIVGGLITLAGVAMIAWEIVVRTHYVAVPLSWTCHLP